MVNSYIMNQVQNNEERMIVSRVNDLIRNALQGSACISDFLDLRQQELAEAAVKSFKGICYSFDGGFEQAERKRLLLFPDWQNNIVNNINCVKMTPDGENLKQPEHRDYLGALLSLGLKREKIGDIVLQESFAYIFMDSQLVEFIITHFERVKHCRVNCSCIELNDFRYVEPERTIIHVTVASMRLDAVLAASFRISRSEGVHAIMTQKVKVNHKPAAKNSILLKEGDIISLRGKGRIKLEEITGLTRKNRYNIRIQVY